MVVLGITGGIGMGKSACGRALRELGVPVVDTDDLAKELVAPGSPALAEIAQVFGADMIDSKGNLRRAELSKVVFGVPEARKQLEAILHPRIRAAWRQFAAERRSEGQGITAVIIPLLFETGAEKELDATVCVACSERTQQERLEARGWTSEEIARRTAAQLPVSAKISQSNFVIWSEGSLGLLKEQVDKVLDRVRLARPA